MPRVDLEPFAEPHLASLGAMLSDPELLRFTRFPDPPPPDFGRQWLARYEAGRADGSREAFAALTPDGELAGVALAPQIDVVAQEAELGYLVTPALRGRGYATAMLAELTRWAFAERDMQRLYLIIDVANAASLQVARHCGYFHEGTLRSTFLRPGAPRADVTLWSRLPTD